MARPLNLGSIDKFKFGGTQSTVEQETEKAFELVELQKELEFFESKKAEWLQDHRDKYVLIKGEEFIDVFASFEDTYKAGVKLYGNQPFLIKKVTEVEPVEETPSIMLGVINAHL